MSFHSCVGNFAERRRQQRRKRKQIGSRQHLLQQLEDRRLLAGPELLAIRPDAGALLFEGDTLNVAPREFNLLFEGGADLDESSINSNTVKLTRAGGDGMFSDGNEVDVVLGYVGLADPGDNNPANLQRIVFRSSSSAAHNATDPAAAFPDDLYQIQIIGEGANPLSNRSGEAFNDGENLTTTFRLDRGAQVVAVVPQPISTGPLSQASDEIIVHFDDQDLDPAQANDPKYYRLVDTSSTATEADDRTSLPESVTYNAATNSAVLKFASDIPEGTYRLDIGQSGDDGSTALQVGSLSDGNSFAQSSFLGDVNGVSNDATDVDRFNLQLSGGALTVRVTPDDAGLNLRVRLIDGANQEVGNVVAAGAQATLVFNIVTPGTHVLEITSDNGATGSYTVSASVTGSPVSNSDNNSTFATATDVGQLGATAVAISAAIERQNTVQLPPRVGSEDEPGHRQIQREQHIGATGTTPTTPAPITTRFYHFPDTVTNNNGDTYVNLITEAERDIVRGIYEVYARYSGFEFVESTTPRGTSVMKGDLRAIDPTLAPDSGVAGKGGAGLVVLNGSLFDQANRFYGDGFTDVMFHELGHSLGLDHSYDQPSNMGAPGSLAASGNGDVLPGDHDIVHLRRIVSPDATDIDMYQFELTESGRLRIETVAERLAAPSLLNSALKLFRQVGADFELVAQNDQYFGADSFLDLTLEAGTYFVGVTSTGNTNYDPRVPDSGYDGTTDGSYELKFSFEANDPSGSLRDTDGTALDGDADGQPGGVYSFWFQATDTDATIYVDKVNDTDPSVVEGNGSIADPYDNIATALRKAGTRIVVPLDGSATLAGDEFTVDDGVNQATFRFGVDISTAGDADTIALAVKTAIDASGVTATVTVTGRVVQIDGIDNLNLSDAPTLLDTPNLVRIVGNGGGDGDVTTLGDNRPYLVGLDQSNNALADGADFSVPQGVTVMIGAGTLLKLRKANIDVGTSAVQLSRSQSAVQILGTPDAQVSLRSFHDDTVGGNSDGAGPAPGSGDFGGIVFRDDSDMEASGVFLNYVNHADIKNGGGKVFVGAQESPFAPLHLIDARPTISFNTIQSNDTAAISASPDSFEETVDRIGPDVNGNFLMDNTINGMFIRVATPLGSTLDELTVSGRFNDTDIPHILTENLIVTGNPGGPIQTGAVRTARAAGRLMIDPGTVLKLNDSRIEAERGGGAVIAEGTENRPIVLTSLGDDRYGGSGSFDTNSIPNSVPQPGDWGGLYFGEGTSGSIDNAIIAFGGGSTPIEGGAASFNAVEVHQGDLRLTNTLLQSNAGGNSGGQRNGRGTNANTTIFVRASQPIIVDNTIVDNAGSAININASSLKDVGLRDSGRSTGEAQRFHQLDDNYGPLVRLNRLDNNGTNGMEIRGQELTTGSIWDDTDIVHVLRGEIIVDNLHHFGGLRLQSSNVESLVVKLNGNNAGFTATGTPVEIIDRIGGAIHVLGTVGHPVVLTHIDDDSVGAGYTPSGEVMFNTNNSNNPTSGTSGRWRGFQFDEYSNDRNVALVRELESPITNGSDVNSTPFNSQLVGNLAPDQKSGDENRRLGFEVSGFISPNDTNDVDIYSFTGTAGTGVWLDIDRTDTALDAILEVVNFNGTVLARSMQSGNLGAAGTLNAQPLTQNSVLGGDHYTQNFRDPGMFYVLPGTPGDVGTYFVRVRSNPASSAVTSIAGESRGEYKLQIRLDQVQEFPGSTVKFADIRFAETGIDVRGLPAHSPLHGDAGELEGDNNTGASAQTLVNLLETDVAALGIAGSLSSDTDVDFYRFPLEQTGVQVISGVNDSSGTIAVVFDIDYSDNAVRGDTTIAVYDENFQLIYVGRESNVTDDQAIEPDGDIDDLSRGSLGTDDPFIGPVHLTPGSDYIVAVMSNRQTPTSLTGVFQATPVNPASTLARLEPVNSVVRVVEDHIGTQGYESFGTQVNPSLQGGLFDIATGTVQTGQGVDAHVTPLSLEDVSLYVASSTLYTADPFASNNIETRVGGVPTGVQDIAVRSDGRMFGYQPVAGVDTTVGALVEINPASGGVIGTAQNDNIPGTAVTPNTSAFNFGNRDERANQFTDSDQVDALTFDRRGNGPSYDIFYSVREADNSSKLYRARQSGDATPASAGNYGNVGDIQQAGYSAARLFLVGTDDAGTQTRILIESKPPGSQGNGINFVINRPDNAVAAVTGVNAGTGTITMDIGLDLDANGVATAAATAQAIVDAINGDAAASALVTAIVYDNNAAGDGANATQAFGLSGGRTLGGGSDGLGRVGRVTGLSFSEFDGTNLFGVTDTGQFISISTGDGQANVLNTLNGISFSGLTLGPQNVEGGVYRNLMFATTTTGRVFAFNAAGQLQSVFQGGANSIQVSGIAGAPRGLAFSPLDFNLWHPTERRGGDAGHGINEAPDGSREAVDGETSFYFGFEARNGGYAEYNGVNAQFGVLTENYQRDLASNPDIANTYNLPAGAFGSLTTNQFSLAGSTEDDRPTVYFNYFLDTENHDGSNNGSDGNDPFRDSARVFISNDNGVSWNLLATNNSQLSVADVDDVDGTAELAGFLSRRSDAAQNSPTPRDESQQIVQELFDDTGGWRQARIDLSQYANQNGLRLRFDFSTAGTLGDGTAGNFGELTSDTRSIRSTDNQHEGFYIDDIIIGYSERGEMVTGAPGDDARITDLTGSNRTQNPDPDAFPDILDGEYQLEVRRTGEYIMETEDGMVVENTFDSNDRHIQEPVSATITSLLGDRNRERHQGILILDSNYVTDSEIVGINVQPGAEQANGGVPHPGSTINFPQLNEERLVPGIVIQNNVIAGSSGIRYAGETGESPQRPVPFGRIVNNTLVGDNRTGTGIEVVGLASPTLLNNLLTDLDTGIDDGGTGTIIRSNFFQDNRDHGDQGSGQIVAPVTDPLFLDAANGNYLLDLASLAVDSSQNTEQDRFDFRNFKAELGIPPSPINAPDRDIFGQLRVDSNTGPGGGGSQVFKDRGATDRSDSDNPFATLLNPIDNDAFDRDPSQTVVRLKEPLLEDFTILLTDATGVDSMTVDDPADPTISQRAIRIEQNRVPLEEGVDYVVGYNELTGVLLLTPLSTLWDQTSVYTITLDNTLIADRVGNLLRANQSDGETRFTIVMSEAPLDFGDAPDEYGTLQASNGGRHAIGVLDSPNLGTVVDNEDDATPSPLADGDDTTDTDDEDGVPVGEFVGAATTPGLFLSNFTGTTSDEGEVIGFLNRTDASGTTFPVTVTGTGLLDAWVDFNIDGDFNDLGEHVISGMNVSDGLNSVSILTPAGATVGQTVARFRLSIDGVEGPNGLAIGGEVEDYRVGIFDVAEPDVNDESYTVGEDQVLVVDGSIGSQDSLRDNDILPADEFVQVRYSIDGTLIDPINEIYETANGTVRIDDAVAGLFTYTPDADFYGTDSFRYLVTTQRNGSTAYAGTASIRIEADNDAPGISNAALRTIEDVDGGFQIIADTLLATAIPDADPMTTLTPQDESNQDVKVIAVDTPNGTLDSNNTAALRTAHGMLTATFDVDGNIQSLIYFPDQDFNSENPPGNVGDLLLDQFTFTVRDDGISLPVDSVVPNPVDPKTATATASIFVAPQNDVPVLTTDDVSITDPAGAYTAFFTNQSLPVPVPTEDQTLVIPADFLLGNDEEGPATAQDEQTQFNGNDGPLTITTVTLADPTLGSISVDGNGDVEFIPADDIFGEVMFTYTVVDQGINQDAAIGAPKVLSPLTQSITSRIFVEPINDIPIAINRTFDVTEVVETRAPDAPLPPATIVLTKDDLLNDGAGRDLQNPTLDATASDITLSAPFNEDNQNLEITSVTVNDGTMDVTTSVTGSLTTASGGTLDVVFASGNLVSATYTPATDHNSNSPNDTFTYVITDDGKHEFPVGTSLSPDTAVENSVPATVTLTVNPTNDLPVFDILPVVDILERDDSLATREDPFLTNVFGAPATATDEQGQNVSFTIALVSTTPGLMLAAPDVSSGSFVDFFPAPDAFGTAVYDVTATDDGSPNQAFTQRFTVNVRPVNDAPRFDPAVAGTSANDPNDANLGFSVANVDNNNDGQIDDATITYTLWEDNSPTPSDTAPAYFIPLEANGSYPVGLLDVFTVGPDNELDNVPGGSQVITLDDFGTGGPVAMTNEGGTLTLVAGGLEYRPAVDYNTAINGVDSFTYTVIDNSTTGGETYDLGLMSLIDDQLISTNTVVLNVMPVNDPPVFNVPMEDEILERDDSLPTRINNFITGVAGARGTALDEITAPNAQTVTFTIALDPTATNTPGLMTRDPDVSSGSFVDFFPAPDAFGSATYVLTGTDNGVPNESLSETFTIHVQPVNDAPRFDSTVTGTSDMDDSDTAYSVDNSGTISYTLREDNTQRFADTSTPYFIPLRSGPPNGSYQQVGLLDVFTVGPANELDPVPGGSQELELLNYGQPPIAPSTDFTTALGGTLRPVFDASNELIGLSYTPPVDINNRIAGFDSFIYQVRDDSTTGGETYSLAASDLVPDRLISTNRVLLNLNPVNDRPEFLAATTFIEVPEDSNQLRFPNYAFNISAARQISAFDEVDINVGQSVNFNITPLDFPAADSADFFSVYPTIDEVSGELTFQAAPNVFGNFEFEVRLLDDGAGDINGDNPRGDINSSIPITLTIDVQPINDAPVIDPAGAPLDFTLLEDGSVEILVTGDNTTAGLLDVFFPGPDNESADILPEPGGNQSVSLGNPIPVVSSNGGSIESVKDVNGDIVRLIYTPRADFVGMDSFIYTVTDDGQTVGIGTGGTPRNDPRIASNTVTFEVLPVNDAPQFSGAANVASDEDAGLVTIANWANNVQAGPLTASDEINGLGLVPPQPLEFVFNQISPNTDLFTVSPTTIISGSSASLVYQTTPDANGTAVFEVFLRDGGPTDAGIGDEFESATSTFLIEVRPVNDAPTFTEGPAVTVDEDSGPYSEQWASGISPGPNDESTQSVRFVVTTPPEYADLFLNEPVISDSGVLRFTPASNANTDNPLGPAQIQVTAIDSEGGQAQTVTLPITINEINDVPIAVSDAIGTDEDSVLTIESSDLLGNDIDPDLNTNANESLSVVMPAQSFSIAGARVTFDSVTGQIIYDPTEAVAVQSLPLGGQVVDSFSYQARDAAGEISGLVTVGLTVTGINDAPIVSPDDVDLNLNGDTIIRPLDNDIDVDGTINPFSIQITLQPAFGALFPQSDGSLVYTPFVSFSVEDQFRYSVADDLGDRSAETLVTISANSSPRAVDDAKGTFLDEAVDIDVAANDSDPDGVLDLDSVIIISQPARGEAIPQAGGIVQYLPDPGFIGRDSFTYQIFDNEGRGSNFATVDTRVVASRLQNPDINTDVNDDGFVTALDALLVINRLSRADGASSIPVLPTDRGPDFYDVNGNQSITAGDAIIVINEISRRNNAGEGEFVSVPVGPANDDSREMAAISQAQDFGPELVGDSLKLVDQSFLASDVIDLIADDRDDDSDDDESIAALDAAMADLL